MPSTKLLKIARLCRTPDVSISVSRDRPRVAPPIHFGSNPNAKPPNPKPPKPNPQTCTAANAANHRKKRVREEEEAAGCDYDYDYDEDRDDVLAVVAMEDFEASPACAPGVPLPEGAADTARPPEPAPTEYDASYKPPAHRTKRTELLQPLAKDGDIAFFEDPHLYLLMGRRPALWLLPIWWDDGPIGDGMSWPRFYEPSKSGVRRDE